MTRQVNGFDVPAVTSSTFVSCCLRDFLLNARGTSRDNADSIELSYTQALLPSWQHATPGLLRQRQQTLTATMASCVSHELIYC